MQSLVTRELVEHLATIEKEVSCTKRHSKNVEALTQKCTVSFSHSGHEGGNRVKRWAQLSAVTQKPM